MAVIDLKASPAPPFPPLPQNQEDVVAWAHEFHYTMVRWARDVVETIKDVADEI